MNQRNTGQALDQLGPRRTVLGVADLANRMGLRRMRGMGG
jgi:hypothetical protein